MKSYKLLLSLTIVIGLLACVRQNTFKQGDNSLVQSRSQDERDEKDDEEDSAKEDSDSGEENEVEISLSDLPQSVVDAINARFVGAKLMEADKIKPKRGRYFYDVEMLYQGKVIEVMFDRNGQMIGEETEDD